mmetsp:Transcript_3607/g.4915  ORF Transcript_3607/g.4915 Transcript_3607/m.4915 type:complete len:246 (+) Transcript_3607:65-802(+)|eukprot:CAMPEP_0185276940 /NCGR_PEP_ID=MMETSP1359-20130426/57425_1 /TAXON_ID=552665 /ORGANISM="Bigelowiella longifila, Strain CCMP242" /LENGTH=245 /DNA_ID=CAMNT_0027870839 /DNA_START=53 /DNA_END=790 /DNA_ORIENTATION=+
MSKPFEKIQLMYWPGRGLMEVPRMMLAASKTEFEDGRYGMDDLKKIESDLACNLGRMPAIKIDGEHTVGQSAAINYYIASSLGYMGSSILEAAQIISIFEHLRELKQALYKVAEYGTKPDPEKLKAFFTAGATDVSGIAERKTRSERGMVFYLGRLESLVGKDGYAVGGKLSLADFLIYNAFAEKLTEKDNGLPEDAQYKAEPFHSLKLMEAALEKAPKVKAVTKTVASNSAVVEYLSKRGKQSF